MEKLIISFLPVLDDFEVFLSFLKSGKQIPLTNEKAQLKAGDLFCLNEELYFKAPWVTNKSTQFFYPELDFFFYVVLGSKMAWIHYEEKNNHLAISPERIEQYHLLTSTEQYFFLLESAWCYVNWGKLCDMRSFYATDSIMKLLRIMAESVPGQEFELTNERLAVPNSKETIYFGSSNKAYQLFWFLGFYKLVPDPSLKKKPDKYTFPFKKIISQEWSKHLVPVLLEQRSLINWNLPLRKEMGQWGVPLGITEEEFYAEDAEGYLVPRPEGEVIAPAFMDAFKPLFEPGELTESLYSKEKVFTSGRYILKVSLAKNLYRIIALGASQTLDDLHRVIQEAYNFDDDHLYAFFMDGERWSDDRFNDPRLEEAPFASEVKLG